MDGWVDQTLVCLCPHCRLIQTGGWMNGWMGGPNTCVPLSSLYTGCALLRSVPCSAEARGTQHLQHQPPKHRCDGR
eukprot:690028-Pelagomonas_calceolata.AAC.2